MTTIQYEIYHSGEPDAAIRAYEEKVQITVANDPGGDGDGDEFAEYMRQALYEWFDGAHVNTTKIFKS